MVMTENGLKPISEVSILEKVLAYNEETGEIGYYPVTDIWKHIDPIIVTLTIEGETIVTTPEHPFFTANGDWVAAADLQTGNEIRTAGWGTGTVEAIRFTIDPQPMYNFTVATAHTYFVGGSQWLVHNDCWGDLGRSGTLRYIDDNFKMSELISITEQLDVDPENVLWDPKTRRDYIRELMLYSERHGKVDELLELIFSVD